MTILYNRTSYNATIIWSVWYDIESLKLFAGIQVQHFSFHRVLSNRFPFGIYYLVEEEFISVYAVLDLRRDPAWIRQRLGF